MKRIPNCPRCKRKSWKKIKLVPRNTIVSNKGWHGEKHPNYKPEAVARLFTKKYECKRCGKIIRSGKPI